MIASAVAMAAAIFFVGWGGYVGLNTREVNEEWFFASKGAWWLRVLAVVMVVVGIAVGLMALSGLVPWGLGVGA